MKKTNWQEAYANVVDKVVKCPNCGFMRLERTRKTYAPEYCPCCNEDKRRIKVGDIVHDEDANRDLVIISIEKHPEAYCSDGMLRTDRPVEYAYSIDLKTGEEVSQNFLSLEADVTENEAKLRYTVMGQAREALNEYNIARRRLIAKAKATALAFRGEVV